MKRLLIPVALATLWGCSSEMDELKQFVRESDKGLPRKIASTDKKDERIDKELTRRKEPLEAFPLEQLKMVGTLSQAKEMYALVRADKTLYRVKKGNYMGQNFGLITDVTEGEIKLKEIVQDSAGDWAERQSVLPLLEEAGKGEKK